MTLQGEGGRLPGPIFPAALLQQLQQGHPSWRTPPLHGRRLVSRMLKQEGWERTGFGADRSVYAQPGGQWVVKLGCPEANRREWDLTWHLNGDPRLASIIPVAWISDSGMALVMPRAEDLLESALWHHRVNRQEATETVRRFQQQGFSDTQTRNIGRWCGHWRMLDYSGHGITPFQNS